MNRNERLLLISENLKKVREKVSHAAGRSGRSYEEIALMVVSKTWSPEIVSMVVENGVSLFGENRIQEAVPKIEHLNKIHSHLEWHLIGHLQKNKAARAVENFDCIQSVDSVKIARRIAGLAEQQGAAQDILLEVNISGEESKFGILPHKVHVVIDELITIPGLFLRGLMTIGPLTADQDKIRQSFRKMKKLFDQVKKRHPDNAEILSMGMSNDFEIAIEEGATMVRLGRAIFGPRET